MPLLVGVLCETEAEKGEGARFWGGGWVHIEDGGYIGGYRLAGKVQEHRNACKRNARSRQVTCEIENNARARSLPHSPRRTD